MNVSMCLLGAGQRISNRSMAYLTSGEFRKDYPELREGEVPPEAFRIAEMRKALEAFDYTLN